MNEDLFIIHIMKINSDKFKIPNIISNKFLRFSLVGGFCALQNILILYFLTDILKLHYIFSTLAQMIFVNTIGFYLNKRYTFKTKINRLWYELWKYHTVMFSSFLTVLVLMYLLVEVLHTWYLYAFIILTIGMTGCNFLMHKKWTFK
jgi:putative flippase GtrA